MENQSGLPLFFQHIMNTVIENSRKLCAEEHVDENVLQILKLRWEQKLLDTNIISSTTLDIREEEPKKTKKYNRNKIKHRIPQPTVVEFCTRSMPSLSSDDEGEPLECSGPWKSAILHKHSNIKNNHILQRQQKNIAGLRKRSRVISNNSSKNLKTRQNYSRKINVVKLNEIIESTQIKRKRGRPPKRKNNGIEKVKNLNKNTDQKEGNEKNKNSIEIHTTPEDRTDVIYILRNRDIRKIENNSDGNIPSVKTTKRLTKMKYPSTEPGIENTKRKFTLQGCAPEFTTNEIITKDEYLSNIRVLRNRGIKAMNNTYFIGNKNNDDAKDEMNISKCTSHIPSQKGLLCINENNNVTNIPINIKKKRGRKPKNTKIVEEMVDTNSLLQQSFKDNKVQENLFFTQVDGIGITPTFHLKSKITGVPVKRNKRRINEPELNSDDDLSDMEKPSFECDNTIFCQANKVTRNKSVWRLDLSNGIMNLNGIELVFHEAKGRAIW